MDRTITSTYRLQLRGPQADPAGRGFGFAEAAAVVPYLAQMGVSHLYLSPIFTSYPDSNHNYDVTDPTVVNAELGGIDGLRSLARTAHDAGLGLIVDIVPNHLGVEAAELNKWWWDVLKHGKDSEFEPYFDIDWHPDNGAEGKLGLPVLGEPGDEVNFELSLIDDNEPALTYFDNHFPLAPGTFHSLDDDPVEVYERQNYRLMYWRDGVISYRRFFSVNGLAGIRQENPVVFEHTHRVLRQLIEENLIDGVRVDHPDGLANPFAYLNQLRTLIGPDRYLVAEKILGVTEPLDPRLAVDGTTGYDALRELDGIFINREAEDSLSMLSLQQSGSTWDEPAIAAAEHQLKRDVARSELAAEVRRLTRAIRKDNFSTAGNTVSDEDLEKTVIDLIAAMPVYRADYISLSRQTSTIVADMARRFPSRRRALDLISAALLANGEAKTRFAQVCGAVMAKGVEDTLFYRACRLIALQEVGGAPGRFGVSPAEFHLLQQERATLWPLAMTTLTTHDTKRTEDTRARIIEITERPKTFAELVQQITALLPAPDDATAHFLIQNILGVWPTDGITDDVRQRLNDYAIKAVREAGVHTTWFDNDQGFENAITDWVDAVIDGPASSMLAEFAAELHRGAIQISLGRKLLQLIGPGIPDTYQGQEFFDLSLVDPDNRRFVDYVNRRQTLEAEDIEGNVDRAKQAIVREGNLVRKQHPDVFRGGDYQAVFAVGQAEDHLVGIARGMSVIALATRLPLTLEDAGGWGSTTVTLPEGTWTDRLSGQTYSGTVACADVFRGLPCALLVRD